MELLAFLVIAFAGDCLCAASSSKIVNGELAVERQFPHMVQLAIRRREATKYCGGSLIDAQWVLTAAHCLKEMVSAKAYLGSVFMRTMTLKLKIADAAVHPDYENINAHDIALLKLEKPILNFTENIKAISLPSRHQASFDAIMNSTLYVPGFGQTKNASQSNLFLRYVKMRAITIEQCSDEWGWKMRETLLCSQGFSNFDETTCSGDSGNGLITNDDEATIFGIVSYGAPGCLKKPKVFTRVTSYLDFIHSVTGIEIKT